MESESIKSELLQPKLEYDTIPSVNDPVVTIPQPIEEMLGSVTTYNNLDGTDVLGSSKNCQQLRTSARVFKKMKLDSALALITAPTPEKEKKELVKEDGRPETKKPFRPSWSTEDKDLFFEGLNEYGKDFDAIQQHINNKFRKKGLPETVIKTKDQVRTFYYRTWHKVSKHLKFSEDIKKVAQELYALINYGEIRKKLGSVSEKVLMKLNELIYRGAMQIRSKGKTIRVKTPMCRALRRLNQLDEKHEDLKLPARVIVELRPRNMESWHKVQFLSQNPRIRVTLPLQRRFSALLTCLNERWRTQIARNHEKVLNAANSISEDGIPEEKISEESKALLNPLLRLAPKSNTPIEIPTINLSEYLTSHRICLNAYEERICVKIPGEQLWQHMCASFKGGGRGSSKKSVSRRLKIENSGDKNGKIKDTCDDLDCDNGNAATDIVDTLMSLQKAAPLIENVMAGDDVKSESSSKVEKSETNDDNKMKANDENKIKAIEKIRSGWTLEDCGTLTVGELYLMFGKDSKLEFEYSWDTPKKLKLDENSVATTEIVQIDENENRDIKPQTDLSVVLKKLLSVAKLHYRKEKISCPCGHICGGTKGGTNSRNKSVTIKMNQRLPNDQQDKNGCLKNSNTNEAVPNTTFVSQKNFIRNVSVKQDSVFRRPNVYVETPNTNTFTAQLDSLQKMKPRYCNRRGRPVRAKQVVVERMLPLLPKPPANGHPIVPMKIINQPADDKLTRPRPIAPKLDTNNVDPNNFFKQVHSEVEPEPEAAIECAATNTPEELIIPDGDVTSSTTISSFLNLDIPGSDTNDLILTDGSCAKDDITSFAGLLSDDPPSQVTPLSSPSRILKDINWLNSEVNDYSLTSLLGHLESPMKAVQAANSTEDSTISPDIDVQFPSLLGENGVDFVEQFVDMAAQVTVDCNVIEQVPNS